MAEWFSEFGYLIGVFVLVVVVFVIVLNKAAKAYSSHYGIVNEQKKYQNICVFEKIKMMRILRSKKSPARKTPQFCKKPQKNRNVQEIFQRIVQECV